MDGRTREPLLQAPAIARGSLQTRPGNPGHQNRSGLLAVIGDQRGHGSISLIALAFGVIGLAVFVVQAVRNQAEASNEALGHRMVATFTGDGSEGGSEADEGAIRFDNELPAPRPGGDPDEDDQATNHFFYDPEQGWMYRAANGRETQATLGENGTLSAGYFDPTQGENGAFVVPDGYNKDTATVDDDGLTPVQYGTGGLGLFGGEGKPLEVTAPPANTEGALTELDKFVGEGTGGTLNEALANLQENPNDAQAQQRMLTFLRATQNSLLDKGAPSLNLNLEDSTTITPAEAEARILDLGRAAHTFRQNPFGGVIDDLNRATERGFNMFDQHFK